jgi:hypothetical protein
LLLTTSHKTELLLKAGADPNARNLEGATPLTNSYDDDVKRLLREHGALEVKTDEVKD